jgi:hypothetical protein
MLPHSQFIDFPAFYEKNKLGESYNFELSKRCDIMAQHIALDFLLVPDICVCIVKTLSPDSDSLQKLIAHILELETGRNPTRQMMSSDEDYFNLPRTNLRTEVYNRLARESVLLCSLTQNFICRLEPANSEIISSSLSFDPGL